MSIIKSLVSIFKFFIIGVVWTLVYAYGMTILCAWCFDFHPLKVQEWQKYFVDFLNSDWIIDSGKDVGLVFCMILFIPMWFIGWIFTWKCMGKFHLKMLIPRFFLEKKVKKKSIQTATSRKSFVPNKLRVQSNALLSVSASATTAENNMASPYNDDAQLNTPESEETTTQTATMENRFDIRPIVPLVADLPVEILPDIYMDSSYASFALASDDKALIFNAINKPDSTWVADIETELDEGNWYNESSILTNPTKDIRNIVKNLEQSEENSKAIPAILLMSGTLLNPEETKAYFEAHDVLLLRLEEADADGVPLLSDFAKSFFEKVQNESSDANPSEIVAEV